MSRGAAPLTRALPTVSSGSEKCRGVCGGGSCSVGSCCGGGSGTAEMATGDGSDLP